MPATTLMKVLLAEDDQVERRVGVQWLRKWGYDPEVCADGEAAWRAIQTQQHPWLLILDWQMPGMDGIDLCRRIREMSSAPMAYVIMLTGKRSSEDMVAVFDAGADDYVQKPPSPEELRARIRAGERILALQQRLAQRVAELEATQGQVDRLERLLPICSYCKKIRVDENYWQQLERYFSEHSNVRFSHGICPTCFQEQIEGSDD